MLDRLDIVSLCVGATFAVVAMYQFGPRKGDFTKRSEMRETAGSERELYRDTLEILDGQTVAEFSPEVRLFVFRSLDATMHSTAAEMLSSSCKRYHNPFDGLGVHNRDFKAEDVPITPEAVRPPKQ